MERAVLVITNDTSLPEVKLEVTADVKPRAYMSSDTIRLTGNADKEIKQSMAISPTKENPFTIKEITTKNGDNIRYTLDEIKEKDGINTYQLTVYNTKKEKGWYLDTILIKTDSEKSPEFEIKVFGLIRDSL